MNEKLTPEEYFKKLSKIDKTIIRDFQETKKIDFISTGSWVLDTIIGDGSMQGKPGGFPRGYIVELLGDESSGKTTIALSAIRKAQEMGGLGILMDFEQSFYPEYAKALGLDLSRNKLIVFEPVSFQQGARIINDCLSMKPHIIVVDSVTAMIPQEVLEGKVDDTLRIGLKAQLMSNFLNYISKFLKESNTCLLFTNQLRSIIKKSPYEIGPDEESTGGRALKFYSALRINLKTRSIERRNFFNKITGKEEKEPVDVKIMATVIKNRIDKPWYTAPIYIRFGEGIDNVRSIIELAINTNVIKKNGAFYIFKDNNEVIFNVKGQDQLWQILHDNEKIYNRLVSNLTVKEENEELKKEYQDDDKKEIDVILNSASSEFIKKANKKKEQQEEATRDD